MYSGLFGNGCKWLKCYLINMQTSQIFRTNQTSENQKRQILTRHTHRRIAVVRIVIANAVCIICLELQVHQVKVQSSRR